MPLTKPYFYTFVLLLLSYQMSSAQGAFRELEVGAGIQLTLEIQVKGGLKYRVAATGGISQYIALNNYETGLLPTAHLGVLLYNRGLLGSNLYNGRGKLNIDFIGTASLHLGVDNQRVQHISQRDLPLYHFSDFVVNPLKNGLGSSFGFGMNLIASSNPDRGFQRIGFFNIKIKEHAQLSYYNDGGPILDLIGDEEDRFFTGGLTLAVYHKENYQLREISLSFHKFTGWTPGAVDAADKLQLDHIPYADEAAFGFNQQLWSLRYSNITSGEGGYISVYDLDAWDLQDKLHFERDFPYHPDYNWKWRIAGGFNKQWITD